MNYFRFVAYVIVWALTTNPLTAQPARYDVGRKLIAFEQAWDGRPDPAARKRAVPPLKKALTAFFAGGFADAGRSLDEARHALAGDPPTDAVRWADSVVAVPQRRVVEPGAPVAVRWVHLYPPGVARPADAEVRLTLTRSDGVPLTPSVTAAATDPPLEQKVDTAGLPEGDHRLVAEVIVGGATRARYQPMFSVITDLNGRTRKFAVMTESEAGTTETLTARMLARNIALGGFGETDCPAHRLLGEVEAVAERPAETVYTAARPCPRRCWPGSTPTQLGWGSPGSSTSADVWPPMQPARAPVSIQDLRKFAQRFGALADAEVMDAAWR
jgi:hypothetical protein